MTTLYSFGGTSASGKSTRVFLLLNFLKERFPVKTFTYKKDIGYLVNDRILFIGKEVYRKGSVAWQGLDSVFRDFADSYEELYNVLFEFLKKYSVITESSVMMKTARVRPRFLNENSEGFDAYFKNFYFDDFETYKQRIEGRGGKTPTPNSAMWVTNKEIQRDLVLYQEELNELPEDKRVRFTAERGDPKEPFWSLGVAILEREGMSDLVESFKEYCDKNCNTTVQKKKRLF